VKRFYKQTDERVSWQDPNRAQIIKSLNDAHDANRLHEQEIGRLNNELLHLKLKYGALAGILGGLAFKGLEVVLAAFLKP
jgi:hypothetical protein